MILHPGILALLLGAGLVLLLQGYAGAVGLRILRHWDRQSSSELQLELERRTVLISTLLQHALVFQGASLLLFVDTAERLHPLFVGAMCATGTLNAHSFGWTVLWLKIAGFFLAGLWLVVNHYDQQAEDYPLVRAKYRALLFLLPLTALDAYGVLRFFLGLQPQIITSCCGALFGGGSRVASTLAALPAPPMIWAFYGTSALLQMLLWACLRRPNAWLRYALALLALVYFGVVLAALVSFISVYIYQRPTHHCPFDLLQGGYGFVGYPLYLAWFGTVLCGLVPGLLQLLRRVPTFIGSLQGRERVWLWTALALLVLLVGLVSWPLLFGTFILPAAT